MPFPLIPLAIAGGQALLGRFLGGGTPKYLKEMQGKINPVQSNLINWSGEDMDFARLFRQMGLENMQDVEKFFRSLLGSDTKALDMLLGPARSDIAKNYQSVLDTANRGPRGGGRTAAGMEFDFAKAGELLKLVPQARMQAAGQLGELGQQGANLGLQFGQSATQRSATVLDSIASIAGGTASDRARSAAGAGGLANQIGQILGPFLKEKFPKYF